MAAMQAFAVAKHLLVHDIADLAARDGARRCADKATQQRTSQATKGDADGASKRAERCPCLGAGQAARGAAGSTGHATKSSASLAARMARGDVPGVANRTNSH
ncbi:hypothetical protein [Aquabacterium sp.]|uniref:hypothetical protein n=1 Tax=Aquabacterium sp. TaxID=1872578 RepID=UPI0035C752FC